MTTTQAPPVAILLDRGAARLWLQTGTTTTAAPIIDPDFSRHSTDFVGTVQDLLCHAVHHPGLLRAHPDVDGTSAITVWRIAGPDGSTECSLITLDLASGVRLASRAQDNRDYTQTVGAQAALDCLSHVVAKANSLYAAPACAGRLVKGLSNRAHQGA